MSPTSSTQSGISLGAFPELATLFQKQVAVTPRHADSLKKRLASSTPEHLAMANQISGWIIALAGDRLPQWLSDYDWICKLMIEEEFHFRRHGTYRLKTFAQAVAEVYSNDELMAHYMNGLLMTNVWWSNHTDAMRFYVGDFLGAMTTPFRHLEIGPGHGLLLYLAGRQPLARTLEAWDVSSESIDQTRAAIKKLGGRDDTRFAIQDIFAKPPEGRQFDTIVLSEVLEHLETPREALGQIRALMAPGGRLFINMPINSPAPDHLFLLKSPEEVVAFVESCGYRIEKSAFLPQTNMTLEKARRTAATITVVLIAQLA